MLGLLILCLWWQYGMAIAYFKASLFARFLALTVLLDAPNYLI